MKFFHFIHGNILQQDESCNNNVYYQINCREPRQIIIQKGSTGPHKGLGCKLKCQFEFYSIFNGNFYFFS